MNKDCGATIKITAQVIRWVGIIGGVIWGLILLNSGEDDLLITKEFYETIGTAVLIGVPLLAWFVSLMIYGFGEMVENSTRLADHFCPEEQPEKVSVTLDVDEENRPEENGVAPEDFPDDGVARCEWCGKPTEDYPCVHCGYTPKDPDFFRS